MGNQNHVFYNQMSDQLRETLQVLPFDHAAMEIEQHVTSMIGYEEDVELRRIVEAIQSYRKRRLGETVPGYNALGNN